MSGNINDTNVALIKKQVHEIQNEIKELSQNGECISDWEDALKRKYKALSKTSATLFKYILTNYNTPSFNEQFFNQTLELMLTKISSIQKSEMTQEDASVNVGVHLAKKYVPQLKK